ncbi:hypothetical protein [Nocardioides sp. Soil777]|uniref:hypothetical protein n=1 Tax=Nocardioides sp. Soil777 TaxID=1736409 RepID=UPI0007025227|nr:hypothetical protein [Nocardioides sp. Soil777]
MEARAGKTISTQQADPPHATAPPSHTPSWRQRLRAWLRSGPEEDGVFRPVRLPLWIDLAISAAIIAVATCAFVGFFVWLARTQ